MSLEVATWVTGIATAVLAVFAIITAWYARKAFRKQAEEVGLLLEQANRDIDERRRAQAVRVFLGVEADGTRPVIPYARNASEFPVYSAKIWYWAGKTEGSGEVTGSDPPGDIMPGQTKPASQAISPDEPRKHAFLTFRDAQGVYWIRTPSGEVWEASHLSEADDIRALATTRLTPLRNPPLARRRPDNRQDEAGQERARLRRASLAVLLKRRARG
jgi:hypothetical protein